MATDTRLARKYATIARLKCVIAMKEGGACVDGSSGWSATPRRWPSVSRSAFISADPDRAGGRGAAALAKRPPTPVSPPPSPATCRAAISRIGARARSACRRAALSCRLAPARSSTWSTLSSTASSPSSSSGPAPDRRRQILRRLRARRAGRRRYRPLPRGGVVLGVRIHHRRPIPLTAPLPPRTHRFRRLISRQREKGADFSPHFPVSAAFAVTAAFHPALSKTFFLHRNVSHR